MREQWCNCAQSWRKQDRSNRYHFSQIFSGRPPPPNPHRYFSEKKFGGDPGIAKENSFTQPYYRSASTLIGTDTGTEALFSVEYMYM